MAFWEPQPGPQTYAATCPADVIMFGGMRGGGKSDCIIGRQVRGAEIWKEAWNGLVIRRKYKDFAEIRRRFDELIRGGLPAERIGGDNQTNYVKFSNGARVTLAAIQILQQVDDFLGHQYTEISVDEASSIPFIARLIDKLKGCLRSPHGVPCHMILTGNPGGAGANSIKLLYIKKAKPNTPFVDTDGQSAIFIPSSLADNKILCKNDPAYVNRLRSIKDPALRAAWLLGDWDAFVGQAFDFSVDYHVIKPRPIPPTAPIYMTYDWGFGKPFSIGWWWVDMEGRVVRFAEWYGWDGVTPDVGCRMTDSAVAEGVLIRESQLQLNTQSVIHLASHDCWNKKPDYKGGGQGPSTAEIFAGKKIYLIKADPSREQKIRQFRERLAVKFLNLDKVAARLELRPTQNQLLGEGWRDSKGLFIDELKLVELARSKGIHLEHRVPMMLVYENCEHFIRTIPSLCVDENNVEDIDTEQEDHVFDDAAQIAMARPMSLRPQPTARTMAAVRIDLLEKRQIDMDQEYLERETAQSQGFWESQADAPATDYHLHDVE